MKLENLRDRVLIRVWSRLSRDELNGLRHYINCPLFNRGQQVMRLFDLVEAKVLRSEAAEVTEEELLAGSEFLPSQLNKLFSRLFQLTNAYLTLCEQQKHPEEQYRYLIPAYQRLGIEPNVFQKEFRRASKLLERAPETSEKLQLRFQMAHDAGLPAVYAERGKIPDHFKANQALLDHYFLVERMKYLCGLRNVEQLFQLERTELGEKQVRELYDFRQPGGLAEGYARVLEIFGHPETHLAELQSLKTYLETNGPQFSEGDLRDLWGYLLNFCIWELPGERDGFDVLTDEIYRFLLDKGWLLDEGKLSSFHFRNIVSIRLIRGSVEWVEDFIEDYAPRLVNGFDGRSVRLARVLVLREKGDFRTAAMGLKELLEERPKDVFWNFSLRGLLWRSYFERRDELTMQELEEMELLFDSFRIYVRRKELVSQVAYQNFIRLSNRLRLLVTEAELDREALAKLGEEVLETEQVNCRAWLKQQMDAILKET